MIEYRIERRLMWQDNPQWHFFETTSESTWLRRITRLRAEVQPGVAIEYRAVCGHFMVRAELK